MKTSSAKAKGRRCAQEVRDLMLKYAKELEESDIWVTPSGCYGPDVNTSALAYKEYPWAIECKNVEALNVWQAFTQAENHVAGFKDRKPTPILFFRRNRSELMVCLKAEDFFKIFTRK